MNPVTDWREVWEECSREQISDFELDRGIAPRVEEIEALSTVEHVNFIDPQGSEVILDAGCGTGVNILRLHSRVRKIIGIDYASGSVERCHERIRVHQIHNAEVYKGSLTSIPLPDKSVDKILCLSVLQYLNDDEVKQAFHEFERVLTPGGTIILHVKNSTSLYWVSLRIAKRLKGMLGGNSATYHVRPFRWYIKELKSHHCEVAEYESFNLLTIDRMPQRLVSFLQGLELRHQISLFRIPYLRRCGADLKIRAILASS